MTKDDVIRMAREAGAAFPSGGIWHRFDSPEELERFANLVAAAEREEIAKLADSMNTFGLPPDVGAAIRARGTT